MAAGDLTTLQDVKELGRFQSGTDDVILQRLVTAASGFVVTKWRNFLTATYTEVYDGKGASRLVPRNSPIRSIASLSLLGVAIAPQTSVLSSGYAFSTTAIDLYGYTFPRAPRSVAITYTAGYDTPPADLSMAVAECVVWKYKKATRLDQSQMSLPAGGGTVTFSMADLPKAARAVFDSYTPGGLWA